MRKLPKMSKAKRRVKTFPKRKDTPKTMTGFVGTRFVINGADVDSLDVAVIGDYAFKITQTQRHGIRRAVIIDRAKLFATRVAAVEAMKPTLGYVLGYGGKITPVRITRTHNGDRSAYSRGKKPVSVHGTICESKKEALKLLLKRLASDLTEKRSENRKAENTFERARNQLEKLK